MTARDKKAWTHLRLALSSTFAEGAARILAFAFFAVLARFAGPGLFGEVRAALSASQIAAGLGVPFLTSVSRLGGGASPAHASRDPGPAQLSPELTGWFLFTLLGALAAGFGYGFYNRSGAAVFLCTVGFGCNYFGMLVARSYQLPRALMFVTLLGNAGQLAVLLMLMLWVPRAVTADAIVVVYACAFILPVAISRSLRRFTTVRLTTLATLAQDLWTRRPEYLSQLAQHISHVLVVGLDLLVLSLVVPSKIVGEYAAIKGLLLVILLPATALFHMVIPASVRRLDGQRTAGDLPLLWIGSSAVVAAAATTAVFGEWLMRTIYGTRYLGLGLAVAYGALGAGLYGLSLLRGATWIARGRTGAFSVIVSTAAILEAAALVAFPALATPLGAASAWTAANAAVAAVMVLAEWVNHGGKRSAGNGA